MSDYELVVCSDCANWITNRDLSGATDEDAERVVRAVEAFCVETGAYLFVDCGDDDEHCTGFSPNRCDICAALPGARHRAVAGTRTTGEVQS